MRSGSKKKFKLFDIITITMLSIAVIILIAMILCKSFGFVNKEVSEGSEQGIVYKLVEDGIIWKTYEGELSLDVSSDNSFSFSVTDQKVFDKINELTKQDKKIKLTYKKYLLRGYEYGSTNYDVVDVEIVE